MISFNIPRRFTWLIALILFCAAPASHAQWITQQITLTPGWNAVFLEVNPQPADSDVVFSGLPVESVWEWNRRSSAVQFIQDPNTLIPKTPEWSTWFPDGSPSRFLSNLFEMQGGRAYLIKVSGTSSVQWRVTGIPARPDGYWNPDSFNLTGFFVASSGAPTFTTYFAPSPAHVGQQIFQLDAQGKWVFTAASSAIQRGKAYWVKTSGGSDYTGPVTVGLERSAGIDFGTVLEEADVIVNNRNASTARTVSLQLVNSEDRPAGADTFPPKAGPVVLYYRDFETVSAEAPLAEWKPFTGTLSIPLSAGSSRIIRVSTRRSTMSGSGSGGNSNYQGLLRMTESGGTRQDIPVSVGSKAVAPTVTINSPGVPAPAFASPYAGLWVGNATVNKVSWAVANRKLIAAAAGDDRFQNYKDPSNINFDDETVIKPVIPPDGLAPDEPRPTKSSEFQFRVIIHVNAAGEAKLLQRVIQVWENGTVTEDSLNPGLYLPGTPGHFRLFSNEQGARAFSGATVRTGVQIPKRLSTAAYPVVSPLMLAGSFGSASLTGTVNLGYDDPLNPFVHKYHPQHDNLNARYDAAKLPPGVESLAVARAIVFEFLPNRSDGLTSPGWGESELGGSYTESITGLHRSTLHVAGSFTLRRVSSVSELD